MNKKIKRILALILAFVLLVSDTGAGYLITLFADDTASTTVEETTESTEETEPGSDTPASPVELREYTSADPLRTDAPVFLTGLLPVNAVATALPVTVTLEGLTVLAAYNITIYADAEAQTAGTEWQPEENTVQIHFSDVPADEDTTLAVYHIPNETETPELVTTLTPDADGDVSFDAPGFSVYVIVEHEGGDVVTPRVIFHFISDGAVETPSGSGIFAGNPYSFKNMANAIQTTQILKDGEALELIADPGNKPDPDDPDLFKFFYGWYVVTPQVVSGVTDENGISTADGSLYFTWPDVPSSVSFEAPISISQNGSSVDWTLNGVSGSGTPDADGNVHVFLVPVFEKYNFVSFMLRPYGSATNGVMTRKLIAKGGNDSVDLKISDVRSTSTDPMHLVFTGWEYNAGTEADPDWRTYLTVDNTGAEVNAAGGGVYLTINTTSDADSIELYPIFTEARWVDFVAGPSGSGATYVASEYREAWGRAMPDGTQIDPNSNAFDTLTLSRRAGYDFDGWYAFAKMDSDGLITNLTTPDYFDVTYLDYSTTGEFTQKTVTIYTTAIKISNGDGTIISDGDDCGAWKIVDNGDGTGTLTKTTSDDPQVLFDTTGGHLRLFDALDRLTLHASWIPSGTLITLVYWTENEQGKNAVISPVEKENYTSGAVKTITTGELNAQLGTNFASGSTITPSDLAAYMVPCYGYDQPVSLTNGKVLSDDADNDTDGVKAVPAGDGKFFELNSSLSDASKVINGDGSTVINLYFSRMTFKLVFHIGRDNYVKNGGNQKTAELWDGNWIEFMFLDSHVTDTLGYNMAPNHGRKPAASHPGLYSMTYNGVTYDSTYVTTNTNVMGDYVPDPDADPNDANLYVIEAKYGAYIGDLWPSRMNPNFSFEDKAGANLTLYIWGAYYGSLYCRIANERPDGGDVNNRNPDINGVYDYMSEDLCSNREGTEIINANHVHHLVAYYGTANKADRFKKYHMLYLAVPGATPDGVSLNPGTDYAKYSPTTWATASQNSAGVSSILGGNFYEPDPAKVVISNVKPQYQLGDTEDGYKMIYSCYDGTLHTDPDDPSRSVYDIYFFYAPLQYSLTFKYENEQDWKVDSYYLGQSLADAKKPEYEDPQKEGYYFLGWYDNEAGIGEPFDFAHEFMPEENVILYPVMRELSYVVKIDPAGGVIDHINYDDASAAFHYTQPAYTGFNVETGSDGKHSGHQTSQSTYFNATYGTPIGEYAIRRDYVKLTDKEQNPSDPNYYDPTASNQEWYYYINTQFGKTLSGAPIDGDWGLNADLRNAVYVTENQLQNYYQYYCHVVDGGLAPDADNPNGYFSGVIKLTYDQFCDTYVSGPYRPVGSGDKYSFMGWYQVFDDGTVASMPYNFNDPVYNDIELRAQWRYDGGYYIKYNPYYLDEDDTGYVTAVVGQISDDAWTDPKNPSIQLYSDRAVTNILRAPTNVTAGYVFRGWRVVRDNGPSSYSDSYRDWVPYGPLVYYQPGDEFIVDSELVSEIDLVGGTGKIIHLQAYYEKETNSSRRPEVTNLVLDANEPYGGYVNTSDATQLPALDAPGSSTINTADHLDANSHPTQILFGDFQSNMAIHLYRYATTKTFDGITGKNFFSNDGDYMLIGFDPNPDPRDTSTGSAFVPAYSPDSVISIPRTETTTLYAMWEPKIYVTFVNTTNEPITVNLSGTGTDTIRIVNSVTGEYDREESSGTFTVPANDQVKIVLPAATAGTDTFTATAMNDHVQKTKMSVSGQYGSTSPYGTGSTDVPNGYETTYSGILQLDANGLIVTYTEVPDAQVDFDVNTGTWTETSTDYVHSDLDPDLYYIDAANIENNQYRPSDPTHPDYFFLGWTTNPYVAAHHDFTGTNAVTWGPDTYLIPEEGETLLNVVNREYIWDFSKEPPYDETLYAVWAPYVTLTFDLQRTGSSLHVWNGPATSDVDGMHVFYRESPNSRYVTYKLAPGEIVPKPEDPSKDPSWNKNVNFVTWITVNSRINDAKLPTDATILNNTFDFTQGVSQDITLYTSWTELKPQIFTFTVENHVVDGSDDDVFTYSIAVVNEKVFGKLGTSSQNSAGTPDRRWGSVTTTLKNNETYTVRVKVTPSTVYTPNVYAIEIDVIDRSGQTIKTGHMVYCNKNTNKNYTSAYRFALAINQEEKDGYLTEVDVQNVLGISFPEPNADDPDTLPEPNTFKFLSKFGESFAPALNGYDTSKLNNSLTVVFTNTGTRVVAPTGLSTDLLPYILMLGFGTLLCLGFYFGKHRKKI